MFEAIAIAKCFAVAPLLLVLCLVVYACVKDMTTFIPIVAIMYLYDVLLNMTLGSLVFWQLPFGYSYYTGRRCWTLSDRIQNIVVAYEYKSTLRYRLAYKLALFINAIDPNHIKGLHSGR